MVRGVSAGEKSSGAGKKEKDYGIPEECIAQFDDAKPSLQIQQAHDINGDTQTVLPHNNVGDGKGGGEKKL